MTAKTNAQRRIAREKRKALENAMETWLKVIKAPAWVTEHRFHPKRQWRFDFAWPELKIAVECEGLVRPGQLSRHTTNSGFTEDCAKYNGAAELGWLVFRYTATQIRNRSAASQLGRVFENYSGK